MSEMKIYDYQILDNYENLKDALSKVIEIKSSLADNRQNYRKFANEIGIKQDSLFDCLASYEKSLLIGIYTSSEQLFKNFYYQLIEMGTSQNIFLNQYFRKKLDPGKFSPNVQFGQIESSIKEELIENFKFNINNKLEVIDQYNSIVRSRHSYAHRGQYTYTDVNGDNFRVVIEFINYMAMELYMIVNSGVIIWKRYSGYIDNLKEFCEIVLKNLQLIESNEPIPSERKRQIKSEIKNKIKDIKIVCKDILKLPDLPLKCVLLNPLYIKVLECSEMDLRKEKEYFTTIRELNDLLKNYCFRK